MRVPAPLQAAACLLLFLLLQFGLSDRGPRPVATGPEQASRIDVELAQLHRALRHAGERSPEATELREKIRRRRLALEGRPEAGHANEFARLLWEMKIPADRGAPEYASGYRAAELRKAERAAKAGPPLPWVSRGPGNVAGRARGIIVHPSDPSQNTWLVGSVGGGVWKTTDAGATWTVLTDDMPNLPMSAIAMSPADPNLIYAGTGESFFNIDVINGNGIIKSTDGGASWTQLASTVDDVRFNNIARIIVDPTDPDLLVVAATTGRYKSDINPSSSILRSTDGGATWTEVYTETEVGSFNRVKKVLQLVADPSDFSIQYATIDEKGILKSTDTGQTWSLINSGITSFAGRFELAISTLNTDYLFASAEGFSHSELFVSVDGGANWFETFEQDGFERNWLGAQGWYDNTIVCHPTDPDVVFVGGIRLWKIEFPDGVGTTSRVTTQISSGPVHVDHHNLKILDAAGAWRIVNANDGGIGLSSSQDTGWSAPIDGMITTQFYGIDKRPGGSAYVGGMQDNGTWRSPLDPNSLDPWFFQIGGDGYETSWHFDDPLKIIGGSQFNGLRRSLDGGTSWSDATGDGTIDTGAGNAPFVTKIAQSNQAPDLVFAVGANGVWRSADFGGSWSLSAIPQSEWGGISSFHDVRISRADPDVVWAGSAMDGSVRMQVSTDGGLNFASTNEYPAVTMGGISGLATDPHDANTAYVLFSFAQRPKVLKTTDLGVTWTDISGFGAGSSSTNGFPDVAIYDLLVFSDDPQRIWVASEIGLIESTDGGATWALAENGLPNVGIWMLREVEDEIVAATHGRGVWSVTIPSLVENQTFNPLIESVAQAPLGDVEIELNLRSVYDSTEVYFGGGLATTLPTNVARELQTVSIAPPSTGVVPIFARGFRDGETYDSVVKNVEVLALAEPVYRYADDFDTGSSDFSGNGFTVGTEPGFSDSAIHSPHPYADAQTLTYLLSQPIRVAGANAIVAFDEVCIVEPGQSGVPFNEFGFWDFVIVEASKDGVTWLPLADGYDARFDPDWLNAYQTSTPGSAALFERHEFDLLSVFEPHDVVLLRVRLVADGFVTGWGWVIDNLEIQTNATRAPTAPPAFALEQNVPNPFNPSTEISYRLPARSRVSLRVFDVRGRLVRELVDQTQAAGPHRLSWDGRDDGGVPAASGVYLYRLKAGDLVQQRKMTLLK